jgi:hypothetical protein
MLGHCAMKKIFFFVGTFAHAQSFSAEDFAPRAVERREGGPPQLKQRQGT